MLNKLKDGLVVVLFAIFAIMVVNITTNSMYTKYVYIQQYLNAEVGAKSAEFILGAIMLLFILLASLVVGYAINRKERK